MKPEQIALMLIDIQNDFWDPIHGDPALKSFPENVKKLLSISRERGYNIVHVRSTFQPDRSDWMLFYRPEGRGQTPCINGTEGFEFADYAKPKEGEKIVEKKTFDAFINTNLDFHLKSHGIKTILIAGLETSVCVLFTANTAYARKYLPLVVSDACGDSKNRHENSIKMYNDLSFKTITTGQLTDDYQSVKELIETFV